MVGCLVLWAIAVPCLVVFAATWNLDRMIVFGGIGVAAAWASVPFMHLWFER